MEAALYRASLRPGRAMRRASRALTFVLMAGSGIVVRADEMWRERLRVGPLAPSARFGHGMVYDTSRTYSVLYGGANASSVFEDTWIWNGAAWTSPDVPGPGRRAFHVMAYDEQRGVTVVFGGVNTSGLLGDTWEFDGSEWNQFFGAQPPARYAAAMTYDLQREVVVLFGGTDAQGDRNDTWAFDGDVWSQVQAADPPSPRASTGFTMLDIALEVPVRAVIGGTHNFVYFDEVFALNTQPPGWEPLVVTGGFSGRSEFGVASVPRNANTLRRAYSGGIRTPLLFGGATSQTERSRETWTIYPGDTGPEWVRVSEIGPSARAGHAMVYDSSRGVVVLFGGYDGEPRGDTWEYGCEFGDFDCNFAHTRGDIAMSILCNLGPGIIQTSPACLPGDHDGDGDVDLRDQAIAEDFARAHESP